MLHEYCSDDIWGFYWSCPFFCILDTDQHGKCKTIFSQVCSVWWIAACALCVYVLDSVARSQDHLSYLHTVHKGGHLVLQFCSLGQIKCDPFQDISAQPHWKKADSVGVLSNFSPGWRLSSFMLREHLNINLLVPWSIVEIVKYLSNFQICTDIFFTMVILSEKTFRASNF